MLLVIIFFIIHCILRRATTIAYQSLDDLLSVRIDVEMSAHLHNKDGTAYTASFHKLLEAPGDNESLN